MMDSQEGDGASDRILRRKIRTLFEKAQKEFKHQALIEKCKTLYREHEDGKEFLEEFKTALRYFLVFNDKAAVDNVLTFVAKFIIFLYAIEVDDGDFDASDTINESCPFPNGILEFLFKTHGASLTEVRLRCLQLLNKILSGMPENSTISDCVWIKLKETVLNRIQDKSPLVRAQAVLTARKLQDPKNPNCEIIKAFIFHLNDPSSAVRRTVVSSIAFNKFTIGHVLSRTRDISDNVRRNTYIVFSKVRVLNLTIKYRLTILERGLLDRSEMVKKCVQSILLVNWLENFNNDVVKFLEALDVINCADVCLRIVENIFKIRPIAEIVKLLPIDENSRVIPQEKLTPELAVLWRAVVRYFWIEKNDEELDKVLPNITVFCDYVRSFYPLEKRNVLNLSHDEKWEEVKEKEILNHLLELIKFFDFGDELGRSNLKKLISDMLISSRIDNNAVVCLIELLAPVIPSPEMFLHEVTEIISEVREPLVVEKVNLPKHKILEMEVNVANLKVALNDLREKECTFVEKKDYSAAQSVKDEIEKIETELKNLNIQVGSSQEVGVREEKNDPETVCKCLTILLQMIKSSKVKTLTPSLRSLKENFLNQCLTSQDLQTQSLAVQALGLFCILDLDIAKENLFRFLFMLSENGDDEINGPALKSVFDILSVHGIKPFEQLHKCKDEDDESSDKKGDEENTSDEDNLFVSLEKKKKTDSWRDTKFLPILIELLNCKSNGVLKSIAYEGLCRLLLLGDVYSSYLLEKIIINGFSPIMDNEQEDYIRQIFMVFFPIFATTAQRSQEMIEEAFIPTMRKLNESLYGTPEADINPKDVALFLIEHTKPKINKQADATVHVHNNLAMSICREILKFILEDAGTGVVSLYLKLLMNLQLDLADESLQSEIRGLTDKVEKKISDKSLKRIVSEFKKKIDFSCQNTFTTIENTLSTTASSCTSKKSAISNELNSDLSTVKKRKRSLGKCVEKEDKTADETRASEVVLAEDSTESDASLDSAASTVPKKNFVAESSESSD